MSTQEFFAKNIEAELPRFEAVWRALPVEKLDWRPHEKNKSAIELLTSMAFEAMTWPTMLHEGLLDFAAHMEPPKGNTPDELWGVFRDSLQETMKIAASMTDQDWNSPSKIVAGDTVHWETTKEWMAWGFLLDLIHHRGQLSVYIRPMGGKVPSIYGPSGDTA